MSQDLDAELLTTWIDPQAVFAILDPTHPDVFWMDAGLGALSGWSFVGYGVPAPVDHVRGVVLEEAWVGARAPRPEWPAGPFRGGWVGWFAYDPAAERAGASPREVLRDSSDGAVDQDAWVRAGAWVAFDHGAHRAWAVAPASGLASWVATLQGLGSASVSPSPAATGPTPAPASTATARHTPAEYEALIARCHDAIRAGDAYQLCLTTRFEVETSESPAAVYTRLRASSLAHRGGFVRIGGTSLLSASPEEFLGVRRGIVRTRPIKGTRPRDDDPESDAALARELLASEKERAENVMIVDLMRNDLSRVCEAGTVRVDALLVVETYPHVHQLVSTVSGRLRPRITVGELLDRAFPAGSMTGAPKLSAMEILQRLERSPRGIYAGCFGWIGTDGALDLAMVIRSIVMHDGVAVVGAGGGITWSSVPLDEEREVGIKARAPLAALGAGLPSGWSARLRW
ncbi:MAG TPA: aminodeoxychorismate synthase component I [Microbacterium sp.]|nr:aminodeoxychorismate synthase component I [Microbacterium sp.]